MRGPSPLAVLLACLVVLAGCNGLAADGGDASMPDVTPAEVPRDLHGGSVAPGLTRQEVVDGTALLDAHRDLTANVSLTIQDTSRETLANGTVVQGYETTTRYGANRSRFVTEARLTGLEHSGGQRLDRYGAWSNGTVTYIHRVLDGTTRYRREPGRVGAVTDYRLRQLEELLAEFSVTSVRELGERAGHDAYAVTGASRVSDDRDQRVRLVVDERGLVREFRTEVTREDYRERDRNVTVVRTTRYEAIGSTTVERPDWLDAAIAEFASREYVAPGVTTERVVDANELQSAHREALRGRSVTTRRVSVDERLDAGPTDRTNETLRVAADRTNYYYVRAQVHSEGGTYRTAEWSNGSVGYRRTVHDNETDYDAYYGERERRTYFDVGVEIERRGETTVTSLGGGRYRVVVDDFENPRAALYYGEDREVEDLRVEFVVRESGLVERYEHAFTYTERDGDRTVRVRRALTFEDVGSTTVERPGWLAAAANATGG